MWKVTEHMFAFWAFVIVWAVFIFLTCSVHVNRCSREQFGFSTEVGDHLGFYAEFGDHLGFSAEVGESLRFSAEIGEHLGFLQKLGSIWDYSRTWGTFEIFGRSCLVDCVDFSNVLSGLMFVAGSETKRFMPSLHQGMLEFFSTDLIYWSFGAAVILPKTSVYGSFTTVS